MCILIHKLCENYTNSRRGNGMSFLTLKDLREYDSKETISKTASESLAESAVHFSTDNSYDIFLSHSYSDAEVILKVKQMLESYNHSVYVDWINDQQISREKVTTRTAEVLKQRMSVSTSLVYVPSLNSSESKWMQWELGYFDALKRKVAVLPILKDSSSGFDGLEFLGLYPYIDVALDNNSINKKLWVNKDKSNYVSLSGWLEGKIIRKR